ncbi:DNA repair protein RecN [Anaerotruncus sp. 1XD42-93]|uniref:DNA repair protein RecN n=1 Tax=Anaerotruncus sp. 1XD42-93 TaxID=2320853 RepID=UPI000EA40A72|nr:DNA repair protein RecN [Anaerotruncus sp. 1XD42-93]NBK17208.1 DNA repair protein RecN [Anaerotruncus sp. 1XD42-93]RKJ97875.1 DNA repair protein RecN [Anaerotruncus sp. 1XD22-93]
MLSQLYIKNVAVISEASIGLQPGLNVFTGETGAGKTILIGAINAVLGERVSKEMIRTGETRATISALFTGLSPAAEQALAEAGYPVEENAVLIHREISADGKSSCKIDGRPATAAILRSVSALLINVHGQHDNQQLLSPQKHLGFIDSYGELDGLVREYQAAYRDYMLVRRELASVNTDEAQKAHRIDLLSYQVNEIEAAELQPGEEEELRAQRKLIQNSLHVTQALGGSLAILEGGEEVPSLTSLLSELAENMTQAANYMEAAQPIAERLTDISYELEGFPGEIQDLIDHFDCDPSQLDAIERRLDTIYNLKKKYGSSIEEILEFGARAAAELEEIETSDIRIEKLSAQLSSLEEKARSQAERLTQARTKAAKLFVKAVQGELIFLDMPSVQLSVCQEHKEMSLDGADELELFIATNVGEQAKSLAKIASGGELSRIMLSIKNVLADRDNIQTLIFDEVDTGVSGSAAQKIGKKLAQVAENRQVIVVTHLAQVASFARNHLFISKAAREDRTFTTIRPLSREERVRELARISGGEKISEIALRHAEEMLRDAGN